jgi:hypothetical protein
LEEFVVLPMAAVAAGTQGIVMPAGLPAWNKAAAAALPCQTLQNCL